MYTIWEEFSKLIFHVEVNVEPSQAQRRLPDRAPRRAT